MRHTDMRTFAPSLVTAAVILAAGCASPAEPDDRPPESASPSLPPAVSATPPAATSSAATSPPAPRTSTARTSTTPSSDPDMPRDLVGPPVTLTGTVHVEAGCVVLDVKGRRWALSGRPAQALSDGRTATVRGRPTRLPPGCDADRALNVRSVE